MMASGADEDARKEFREGFDSFALVQRLGNLMLVEL
jgi:hypothetical protein